MSRKLVKYAGTKTYMYPNGVVATPERVLADFPAIMMFPHVIETDESEQVLMAVNNLSVLRSTMGIDSSLSETEAIDAIEVVLNAPPVVSTDPTAEERIASALEFQSMMMLPTEGGTV